MNDPSFEKKIRSIVSENNQFPCSDKTCSFSLGVFQARWNSLVLMCLCGHSVSVSEIARGQGCFMYIIH